MLSFAHWLKVIGVRIMAVKESLFFGALGGICPTIAQLAGSYSAKPAQPLPELGVLFGLGLFALLGAIIATGFGAKEIKAAIAAGIAAPAIVTNIVSGVENQKPAPPVEIAVSAVFSGFGAAFAQSEDIGTGRLIDPTLYGGGRVIQIVPQITGGDGGLNLPIFAQIAGQSGDSPVQVGTILTGAPQIIPIPEGTTALVIGQQSVPLSSENVSVDVRIDTAPTFAGDLLWAFGGRRTYAVEDVTLMPR
jgi:hypothetical protein